MFGEKVMVKLAGPEHCDKSLGRRHTAVWLGLLPHGHVVAAPISVTVAREIHRLVAPERLNVDLALKMACASWSNREGIVIACVRLVRDRPQARDILPGC